MSAVAECLSRLTLGEPQVHLNLSLFPLLGDGVAEPGYLLLHEALAQGGACVTELSEAGSVPELRFVNACERPVLLLDGEELVGAKQTLLPKLVESAALDAIDAGEPADAQEASEPRHFLEEAAQAEVERFAAVGEGEDLRLLGARLTGGALLVQGRVVHLCAFRLNAGAGTRAGGTRIARASQRHWVRP
jgi:hypothetical protein